MDRYKVNEIRKHQFIQVPKELLDNPRYKLLTSDSKLLYGLLLDRMELSRENRWINDNNEIYLIFSRKQVQRVLNISDKTCTKAFKELRSLGLIDEVRQGLKKPNLIFIGHIIYDYEDVTLNRKNYDLGEGKFTILESKEVRPNNTNINNTNFKLEQQEEKKVVVPLPLDEIERDVSKIKSCLGELKLTDKDAHNIYYNADGDLDNIVEVYKYSRTQNIDNIVGWLKHMVKPGAFKKPKSSLKETGFNNFEPRSYEYDSLEKRLLGWE